MKISTKKWDGVPKRPQQAADLGQWLTSERFVWQSSIMSAIFIEAQMQTV